jgi:hypothetical protein
MPDILQGFTKSRCMVRTDFGGGGGGDAGMWRE